MIETSSARVIGDPSYNPPQGPLVILHEDDAMLILDKPSGLLAQAGMRPELADCLEARAQAYCPGVKMVHRLDRDTSGILILAKHRKAHRHLGLQFERRHLSKSYQAVVWGGVEGETGHIDAPMSSDWPNRPMQKINPEEGRPAQTEWQVIGRTGTTTRLNLNPITGRTHQLRVHLLSIGHPILGDVLYAPPEAAAHRLHLHAEQINIRHPDGGAHLEFRSPCPLITESGMLRERATV